MEPVDTMLGRDAMLINLIMMVLGLTVPFSAGLTLYRVGGNW